MPAFICVTCGTQFPESAGPPAKCPICEDERQFVPPMGQAWTTLEVMRQGRRNSFRQYEPTVLGVGTEPAFGIGQRALLVRAPGGNVLWDCVAFLDDATISLIKGLGGIAAMAISHPHFYTTMVEWSHAFGRVPIHLHASDREWVMRPDPVVEFWSGERLQLADGITLLNVGGHFEGSAVMHWAGGAEGRGALLSGDLPQVVQDRRWVTFMRSYPNFVPLPASTVRRVMGRLEPFAFERIYGIFWDAVVMSDGKSALARSAARYIEAVTG